MTKADAEVNSSTVAPSLMLVQLLKHLLLQNGLIIETNETR